MGYFQAKSDLNFMIKFRENTVLLWGIEGKVANNIKRWDSRTSHEYQKALQAEATKTNGYQALRVEIAKGVLRAERIASRFNVPIIMKSYPAPAVGGPIISQEMFQAILGDMSHLSVGNQAIYDAINKTIGECEAEVKQKFRRLINPLYWILDLITLIIRIPFLIVQASGFDVGKVEDHFLAKLFKLAEIVVMAYLLTRLGIGGETLGDLILRLF